MENMFLWPNCRSFFVKKINPAKRNKYFPGLLSFFKVDRITLYIQIRLRSQVINMHVFSVKIAHLFLSMAYGQMGRCGRTPVGHQWPQTAATSLLPASRYGWSTPGRQKIQKCRLFFRQFLRAQELRTVGYKGSN